MFDILSNKGPTNEVYGIRDSLDNLWIGTPDVPMLYRDKMNGNTFLSAQSRAKAASLLFQVQLNRSFGLALYDGGEWKDVVVNNQDKPVVKIAP